MTDTSKPQWPWPFPHWDGTRFVMPMEFMTPKERAQWKQKKEQPAQTLEDFPEALL